MRCNTQGLFTVLWPKIRGGFILLPVTITRLSIESGITIRDVRDLPHVNGDTCLRDMHYSLHALLHDGSSYGPGYNANGYWILHFIWIDCTWARGASQASTGPPDSAYLTMRYLEYDVCFTISLKGFCFRFRVWEIITRDLIITTHTRPSAHTHTHWGWNFLFLLLITQQPMIG